MNEGEKWQRIKTFDIDTRISHVTNLMKKKKTFIKYYIIIWLQSTKFIQFVCISFYQLKLYLHTIRFNALLLFSHSNRTKQSISSLTLFLSRFHVHSVLRYFDFEVLIISFIFLFITRCLSVSVSGSVPVSILRIIHLILTHSMCICIQARQPNTIKQQSNRNTASTIKTDS